jgi:hypothetical protein
VLFIVLQPPKNLSALELQSVAGEGDDLVIEDVGITKRCLLRFDDEFVLVESYVFIHALSIFGR